jgi:hypothetical protein
VHFAATSVMVGGAIFDAFPAEPLLRRHVISIQGGKDWVTWVYLAFAVVSGGIWLSLQASSMSGMPLNEVLITGVAKAVFVVEAEIAPNARALSVRQHDRLIALINNLSGDAAGAGEAGKSQRSAGRTYWRC